MPKSSSQVSPISVWGKVITELRNTHSGILFVACGEVTNVKLENNTFVIFAEESNKNIMEVPENFKKLQEIISNFLPNCDILIKQQEKSEEQLKLEKLKMLFGNKLKIKGE